MPNYTSIHTGEKVDQAVTNALSLGYAVCNTAASDSNKTASINNFSLVAGIPISIKFTNGLSANNTLNISSTGQKAIYYNGAAITTGIIGAGQIVALVYDGERYNIVTGGTNVKIEDVAKNSLSFKVEGNVLKIQ